MAAARAAARRQAILSSRGNRLAKLTSSARGDDPGGVYANDDPPLPAVGSTGLEKFIGEETELPKPSPTPSKPQPRANTSSAQRPARGSEQQDEFIRALMGVMPGQAGTSDRSAVHAGLSVGTAGQSAPEDPFSSFLASFSGSEGGPFVAGVPPPRPPRALIQKLIPVLHVWSMLAILLWFINWKEPEAFLEAQMSQADRVGEVERGTIPGVARNESWVRWSNLAHNPSVGVAAVQSLPAFFWAFITLQLMLHSLRIVFQPIYYRPPMLLELGMPYLPPKLSQAILTSLRYFKMGTMVLDDLAVLVFGIGLVVFVSSSWMT